MGHPADNDIERHQQERQRQKSIEMQIAAPGTPGGRYKLRHLAIQHKHYNGGDDQRDPDGFHHPGSFLEEKDRGDEGEDQLHLTDRPHISRVLQRDGDEPAGRPQKSGGPH